MPRAGAQSRASETDFVVETYAEGLNEPIAMEFAPDGRLFVAEKKGALRIVRDGALQAEPVAEIDVYIYAECGLLGLALAPDFADSGEVFLFATVSIDEQQILRLRETDGRGGEIHVVRDRLPTGGQKHNGGCLRFGADGMLYFSIGDNGDETTAQDFNSLAGKICRIQRDGATPPDNPFETPTGSPRAIWAYGLRNPFRFCFAPDGRLFVMDVGSDNEERREEINLLSAGANAGWPLAEGDSGAIGKAIGLTDPIYAYHDEGASPVGCVVYGGAAYPRRYRGNLFHLENTLNKLFRVKLDGDRVDSHTVFAECEGAPVDLVEGPDGLLYYCEIATGRIMRVAYVGDPDNAGTDDGASGGASDDGGAAADGASDDAGAGGGESNGSDGAAAPAGCGAGVGLPLMLAIGSALGLGIRRRSR